MGTENKHHVAWADRLGLNKIWHDAIGYCRMCYGTEDYRKAVFSLYHLVVNIKDGPQLKDKITEYKNGEWEDKIKQKTDHWILENQDFKDEIVVIQDENEKIRDDNMPDLFDYIIQLLEEEGFGFYKSIEIKHGGDGYLHYNQDQEEDDNEN